MEKYEVIGFIAAVFTTTTFIPQAFKTITTGETRSLSLFMYCLLVSGFIAWLSYGILSLSISIIVCNAAALLPALIILSLKIKNTIVKGG